MGDQLYSSPPPIINQPVVPRSTQEAERLIRLPWMPPPPLYGHTTEPVKLCRLSSDDYNSMLDLILSTNMILVTITILFLCLGFYTIYSLIIEGIQQMFESQFTKANVNATKTD